MKRREFIAASAAVAASSLLPQTPAWAAGRKVRLALIGTGMRGLVLLKELVRRDDVEVVALCDIEPIMLGRAVDMVAKAGKAAPNTTHRWRLPRCRPAWPSAAKWWPASPCRTTGTC